MIEYRIVLRKPGDTIPQGDQVAPLPQFVVRNPAAVEHRVRQLFEFGPHAEMTIADIYRTTEVLDSRIIRESGTRVWANDGLFQYGQFALHSGSQSHWKIDCDALTDSDIYTLAKMFVLKLPKFGSVFGIPKGGLRLAKALESSSTAGMPPLIVDDVLTTGASMEKEKLKRGSAAIGAVIFNRGKCPEWVHSLFTVNL